MIWKRVDNEDGSVSYVGLIPAMIAFGLLIGAVSVFLAWIILCARMVLSVLLG